MRLIYVLLLAVLVSCSSPKDLNSTIRAAQKDALAASPYKTANSKPVAAHLKEKDALAKLTPDLKKKVARAIQAQDTVRILQSFDLYCGTCPPTQTQVLLKDTIYTVVNTSYSTDQRTIDRGMKAEYFNVKEASHVYLANYSKLIDVVLNKNGWNANPTKYGNDDCTDNNYSMVTIIFPGSKVESMYVRCWKPFYLR